MLALLGIVLLRKLHRQQAQLDAIQAQQVPVSAARLESEYKPYVPCTVEGCTVEARGLHFNHTHTA